MSKTWYLLLSAFVVFCLVFLFVNPEQKVSSELFGSDFLKQQNAISLTRGEKEKTETILFSRAKDSVRFGLNRSVNKGELELTSPIRCAPKKEALMRFLLSLQQLRILNNLGSADDTTLSSYGLKAPNYEIKFSPSERTLLLGQEHPFSGRRYAKLADVNDVILLDSAVLTPVLDLKFCDLQPFATDIDKLTKVSISGPGRDPLTLERQNDKWTTGKDSENSDSELTLQFVKSLITLEAGNTDGADAPQTDSESWILTFYNGDASESFRIKAIDQESLAVTSDSGFAVSYSFNNKLKRLLNQTPASFLTRQPFQNLSFSEIKSGCLEILARPSIKLSAESECGADAVPKTIPTQSLQQVLKSVTVLASEPIAGRMISGEKPRCRISMILRPETPIEFAIFGEIESLGTTGGAGAPRRYIATNSKVKIKGPISAETAELFCVALENMTAR